MKIKKKKGKKTAFVLLLAVSLVTFCASLIFVVNYYISYSVSVEKVNELKAVAFPSTSGETESSTEAVESGLQSLYALNSDFIGWLSIAGTNIDYPVMQRPGDNEYYLRRDFYGNYDYSGTLFLDVRNNIEKPQTNLIVYGHNMNSATMFSDLKKYVDKNFYEENRYITFQTVQGERRYEIIACFPGKIYPDEDTFSYKYYQFAGDKNEEEFAEYIRYIQSNAYYDTGNLPNSPTELITLSTCDNVNENGRIVVVAKRLP